MKKKIIVFFVALILIIGIFTGCAAHSYGESFKTLAELKSHLEKNDISLLYPTYKREGNTQSASNFISNKDADSDIIKGYKIYYFGAPFFVGVYGYNLNSDALLSENMDRVTENKEIETLVGKAKLYEGMRHNDTMFLIGTININNQYYEIRVTANKEMKDGKFVNAIFKNNENYAKAKDVIKQIIESLQ